MRFLKKRRLNQAPGKSTPTRNNSRVSGSASASARTKIRGALRRNRALVVTLIAVGGVVAALTGISLAQGAWTPFIPAWTGLEPPDPPRFGAATAFDEANGEVLVFGGFTNDVGFRETPGPNIVAGIVQSQLDSINLGDTWGFKGGRWPNHTQSALHSPSPRGYAAMAYDGARRNVVLFGGGLYQSSTVYGDTWTWDGSDWTLQNPPGPRPQPRQNHNMVYDAHRKVVLMFGGRGADAKPLDDTWVWDGSAWEKMKPPYIPSPRHSHAMAYDVCNAQAVMFGGLGDPINNSVPQPGETWTWDGAKWTQEFPLPFPTPRIGASMAYSHRSGRVLLYGGLTTADAAIRGVPTAATDTDVWRWDGAAKAWEKMNSEATTPPVGGLVGFLQSGDPGGTIPPARAYASFVNLDLGTGGRFNLLGGTPWGEPFKGVHSFTNLLVGDLPQVALGDHYFFSEPGQFNAGTDGPVPLVGYTPLSRWCVDPVPIPEGDGPVGGDTGPQAPKLEAREGMREIAQLPILTGAYWPEASRDTHVGPLSNRTPNPNYTPPPDCPNRYQGEDGYSTHLVTDQRRDRVYQFFICDPHRGYDYNASGYLQSLPYVYKLLIEAYHGTTLKPIGRVILRNVNGQPPYYATFFNRLFHDVDRGRFLILSNTGDVNDELVFVQQDLIEKGVDPVVKRITPVVTIYDLINPTFFNHPKTGRAKLLIRRTAAPSSTPGQSNPPRMAQMDLEDNRVDWEANATGCGSLFTPMRSGDHIYSGCDLGGNKGAVVKIPITENADGSESPGIAELFGGINYPEGNLVDPQAGRVLLQSRSPGNLVWVFDGKASRYVGRVQVKADVNLGHFQLGLDQETGRLYVHSSDQGSKGQGGVQIIDTRLTPVPQGIKFPQFASGPAVPIAVLPAGPGVPRRIFTRNTGGTMNRYPDGEPVQMPKELFYRVIADEIPLPEQAELSDLDALTIPVPEAPGKTEVSFDAEGSGYGIRLRSVGGIWSALRPPQQMYDQTDATDTPGKLAPYLPPRCLFPDRELVAGWVPQARLSDLDAQARSSGLEVDANSKTDLEGPFSRCQPSATASDLPPNARSVFEALWPLWQMVQIGGDKAGASGTVEIGKAADGTVTCTDITPLGTLCQGQDGEGTPTVKLDTPLGTGWDHFFKEVECVGDALATNAATVGNIYGSAECVQRQGLVKATARGSATGAGPLGEEISSRGFSVGEGYSTVTVARDPADKGVVVTSVAVARGIQLPGASFGASNLASLSIDRVETKAVAWSNGRPGEERASFERKICGIHTPDGSIPGCLTAAQQQQFVDNWNRGWGINSKMFLPKPDPQYYQGSPGGYIAGVIKPVADEIDDQLFAKDYQKEVPGLVVEFYKNSRDHGLGRQVLQLAAVRAVAGLGVQCNPDYIFSPQANECVALSFGDEFETQYFEEDEEDFFEEEEEFEEDGEWIAVEASGLGESLGSKIGRFLENLPVIRQLPIRQMGEALLLASVWMLLGLPLFFASRRFALNQWRSS